MTNIRFDDQVVIVTGAGGGLGRAYALDIARRGGAVVVNDLGGTVEGDSRSTAMADRVVDEITAAGGRAIANYDSVAEAEGAQNIVDAALQAFGRVDALVNNAGTMRIASLEDSSDEDLESLISVHLAGSYQVSKAVWPHMKRQGYGRLVFTASSAGLFGHEGQGCYGAAKAGVFGLMNGFALEGESHGILCNAIMPNAYSRMTDKAQEHIDPQMLQRASALLSEVQNAMQPEFTAGLVSFLLSRHCTSTHGMYSSCAGRIARAFVGVTAGWQGSREVPATAEDVAGNFDEICSPGRGIYAPLGPADEFRIVMSQPSPFAGGD